MNLDPENLVINGEETFKEIAQNLKNTYPLIIGWTDQYDTQLDILFCYNILQYGSIQGGIKPHGYLYVSIMRVGAFAFKTDMLSSKEYYEEKLALVTGHHVGQKTLERLTELFNGIKKELHA